MVHGGMIRNATVQCSVMQFTLGQTEVCFLFPLITVVINNDGDNYVKISVESGLCNPILPITALVGFEEETLHGRKPYSEKFQEMALLHIFMQTFLIPEGTR